MSILLGVDTGGTYTDAVLISGDTVLASAKSLTTRHDLAVGIGGAVQAVLEQSGVQSADISMASLSTTLATNALVEGQGGRVALILIGFKEADMKNHGLADALGSDPYIILSGGHNHAGSEAAPLDVDTLRDWLQNNQDVSGFAVAAQFATRNPTHELTTAQMIREITERPVTCSHQLSAKLNGPKRALTAVLNARLIGMIDRLINRAEDQLRDLGITAPMMVVRGDGALISADFARERPIETILSGPAASIVGARWMTGAEFALVSDIGGTTTDVALLRDGRPAIDPQGARVGPYRTMVEAVAMRTTGLGGDSEVHFVSEGLEGRVTLGPRRVLPISLIARDNPDLVHSTLDAQLNAVVPNENNGRFVRRVVGADAIGLGEKEAALFERIPEAVTPLGNVLRNRIDTQALKKLVSRGVVQVAALTPSDAGHALGRLNDWDREAAEKALILFGRRRTGAGVMLADNAVKMAQIIIDQLTHQTGIALLEAAFAEEGQPFDAKPTALAHHELMQRGLTQNTQIVRLHTGLAVPTIGLGASAHSYYPAVGQLLGCEMILPEHAGVANAIGAVVGQVSVRRSATVTSPSQGKFRLFLENGPMDFTDAEAAMTHMSALLSAEAEAAAVAAGAMGIQITVARDVKTANIEGQDTFIEADISVEATGRPRIAD